MTTTSISLPSVSEVLGGAADRIEQYGWCQFAYEDDGKVCPLGAISVAAGFDATGFLDIDEILTEPYAAERRQRAQLALAAAERLAERLGCQVEAHTPWSLKNQLIDGVSDWNDYVVQSAEAVIAALRSSAEKARATP